MQEKKHNSELFQESGASGEKRRFEIYNDKFIKVSTHSLINKNSYHLNLSMLAPWPVRHRNFSWVWLASIIYFGFSTLAYSSYILYLQESSKLLIDFVRKNNWYIFNVIIFFSE